MPQRRLETETIDDTLELLDLLMVTELLGKAQREADKQKVVKHPRLAQAVEVLLEAEDDGGWRAEMASSTRPCRGL